MRAPILDNINLVKNMDNISFNVDTAEIIPEILKKYNLDNGKVEDLEKWISGETFISRSPIILDLAIRVAGNNLAPKDLPTEISEKFQIPMTTAEAIAKDVQEKIISKAVIGRTQPRVETNKISPPKKQDAIKKPAVGQKDYTGVQPTQLEKPNGADNYREPI